MEGQLIIGGFHSGPLSTIRFVGFVGLVPFYIWMIYLAFYSAKLIRGAEGTPFYAPAIFFGVPMVIEPFYFTFVFGAYEGALPQIILNGAVLKLIYESLQAYKASQEKPEPGDLPISRRGLHDFVPAHA